MTSTEFLGPYRVGALIGRGGMGSVYEAQHAKTGENVAIKLISAHVADDMRFRRRFDAEIKALQQLRHPNIVRIIGEGEERGQLFYSMELVRGESIQRILRREKRMAWSRVVDIAIQVCGALKHAHDIGVIHRDLKPANLLVNSDETVKLVDFGIAKLFGFGEQTLAGSVLGTADYMAPEQADGGVITTRTDLYSLGSVMYAMLTGKPPFSDTSVSRVMDALRHDRPVSLSVVAPDLPEPLVELVAHLLEKAPEDRPPTALAVGNRLRALKAGLLRDRTRPDRSDATIMSNRGTGATGDAVEKHVNQDDLARDDTDSSTDGGTGKFPADAPEATGSHLDTDKVASPEAHRRDTTQKQPARSGAPDSAGAAAANPSDGTIAAVHDLPTAQQTERGVDTPESIEAAEHKRTHFQTVDDASRDDSMLGRDDATSHSGLMQLVSVVAMVSVLCATAYLFYRSVRTPSADELYQKIEDAGASDRLLAVEPSMKLFLDAYADDPRAGVVKSLNDQLQLDRLLNRLAYQSRRGGGIDSLPAAQESFFLAMQDRAANPQESAQQLRDWLTVFDDDSQASDGDIKVMAALAKSELRRLAIRDAVVEVDPDIENLMARIRGYRDLDSTEEQARRLRAIISLNEDNEELVEVVRFAQKELETLSVAEEESTSSSK